MLYPLLYPFADQFQLFRLNSDPLAREGIADINSPLRWFSRALARARNEKQMKTEYVCNGSASLLQEVGEALFGPRWQTNVARELKVSDRTVRGCGCQDR